jgi:hypothetical protein
MSVFTGVSAALSGARRREAEDFARLLDGGRVAADHDLAGLVALTRSLVPAGHAPAPEFRAALRERLVTEAATRTPAALPEQRRTDPATAPRRPRLGPAVATVALASIVAGGGAAVASTRALPGDLLYGLKLQIEDVQLALADSDLERGRELLDQADARLGEAERLAGGVAADPETRDRLATVLDEMRAATEAGATALTDSYRETGDEEPIQLLDEFVTEQQQRLQDLYDLLDPSLRARVMAIVDELGRVETTTRTLLASAAGGGATTGRASGDGWAVSRIVDHAASVTGTGGSVTELADGGVETAGGSLGGTGGADGTDVSGGGAGNLVGDVVDGVTGGATSGGSATKSPLPANPLPNVTTEPLPDVVTSPLPDTVTSPLPEVTPPLPEVTAPLAEVTDPLPSVDTCVPVAPLTSC